MAQPKVVNAINRPWPTTVEVHFDQAMLEDEELTRPGNYLFNHGVFARSVEVIDSKQVRLIVENLFEYDSFIVVVSDNVKGFTGEGVDQNNNSATFPVVRPVASDNLLTITADNGRLKSGINALVLDEDPDNWYIMTESGIDVVNKNSLMNTAFVLDGYGFNTIAVSG